MPRKIELNEVIKQLPLFVQIIPESYRGIRYEACFIDTEYNEPFRAYVSAVIRLQHGCKTRSNLLRKQTLQNRDVRAGTPIEEVISKLPNYLQIDKDSYKSIRYKARFYDTEYKVWFEAYPCNILREGRGYCKERRLVEFKNQINIPADELQARLDRIYDGKIKLNKESYIDMQNVAEFIDETGKKFKSGVYHILSTRYFERHRILEWKRAIFERDNYLCQVCDNHRHITAHHLFAWTGYESQRFNIENGVTLCGQHHREFHSSYGNGYNTPKQFIDFVQKKGETLANLAREIGARASLELLSPPSLHF